MNVLLKRHLSMDTRWHRKLIIFVKSLDNALLMMTFKSSLVTVVILQECLLISFTLARNLQYAINIDTFYVKIAN